MSDQKIKKVLDWYQNEVLKDSAELESQKKRFIENIKKTSKDKVFEEFQPKKYTLWQRIKKVLMGT